MNTEQSIEATLAFVFDKNLSKVLLIQKKKPVHHAGLLNGLGGKLEEKESHLDCVIREVEEEAGFKLVESKWHEVGSMSWLNWKVSIWAAIYDLKGNLPDEFPEELVAWYDVSPVPNNVIENLYWLIPVSQDVLTKVKNKETSLPKVDIHYS